MHDRVSAHVDSDSAIVELDHVSTTYYEHGETLPVLVDVSLAIRNHELVTLLGPSGCGKSTLLNIISGLLDPDQGTVRMHGKTTTAADRIGQSAYMHQRDLLLPWRDALSNAALALEVQGERSKTAKQLASAEFELFGLGGFERRYPSQLSGGMRQRVAFVRTMVGGQEIVLLDEPFGALDALTRTSAQDWLGQALKLEPRTTLLVTHDVEEAIFLSDHILVFSSRPGSIVNRLTIDASRPRDPSFRADPEFDRLRVQLLEELGVVSYRSSASR